MAQVEYSDSPPRRREQRHPGPARSQRGRARDTDREWDRDQGPDVIHIEPSWTDPRFFIPLCLFLLALFVIGLAFRSRSVAAPIATEADAPQIVADVIAAETRAGFGNVAVRLENGLIVLEGQAQTSTDAAAIGAVARSVEGVRSVDNRLVIVGGAIEFPASSVVPSQTTPPAAAPATLEERLAAAGRVTFETSSSALTPEGSATIDVVANMLIQQPGVRVEIHGHTDSEGESAFNQQLSEERADAVVEALRVRGVDPARLTAIGFGEAEPIEPNITEEGRAVNRRIEFVVII